MFSVPICPACGSGSRLVDAEEIYGYPNRYPSIYVCANFPACDSRVGCHPGTIGPLGTLADEPTRRARSRAHAAFDPIWKEGRLSRSKAYAWLADQLGIPKKRCHISHFNHHQCNEVIDICRTPPSYPAPGWPDGPQRRYGGEPSPPSS